MLPKYNPVTTSPDGKMVATNGQTLPEKDMDYNSRFGLVDGVLYLDRGDHLWPMQYMVDHGYDWVSLFNAPQIWGVLSYHAHYLNIILTTDVAKHDMSYVSEAKKILSKMFWGAKVNIPKKGRTNTSDYGNSTCVPWTDPNKPILNQKKGIVQSNISNVVLPKIELVNSPVYNKESVRCPFIYDSQTNIIYLGNSGTYHKPLIQHLGMDYDHGFTMMKDLDRYQAGTYYKGAVGLYFKEDPELQALLETALNAQVLSSSVYSSFTDGDFNPGLYDLGDIKQLLVPGSGHGNQHVSFIYSKSLKTVACTAGYGHHTDIFKDPQFQKTFGGKSYGIVDAKDIIAGEYRGNVGKIYIFGAHGDKYDLTEKIPNKFTTWIKEMFPGIPISKTGAKEEMPVYKGIPKCPNCGEKDWQVFPNEFVDGKQLICNNCNQDIKVLKRVVKPKLVYDETLRPKAVFINAKKVQKNQNWSSRFGWFDNVLYFDDHDHTNIMQYLLKHGYDWVQMFNAKQVWGWLEYTNWDGPEVSFEVTSDVARHDIDAIPELKQELSKYFWGAKVTGGRGARTRARDYGKSVWAPAIQFKNKPPLGIVKKPAVKKSSEGQKVVYINNTNPIESKKEYYGSRFGYVNGVLYFDDDDHTNIMQYLILNVYDNDWPAMFNTKQIWGTFSYNIERVDIGITSDVARHDFELIPELEQAFSNLFWGVPTTVRNRPEVGQEDQLTNTHDYGATTFGPGIKFEDKPILGIRPNKTSATKLIALNINAKWPIECPNCGGENWKIWKENDGVSVYHKCEDCPKGSPTVLFKTLKSKTLNTPKPKPKPRLAPKKYDPVDLSMENQGVYLLEGQQPPVKGNNQQFCFGFLGDAENKLFLGRSDHVWIMQWMVANNWDWNVMYATNQVWGWGTYNAESNSVYYRLTSDVGKQDVSVRDKLEQKFKEVFFGATSNWNGSAYTNTSDYGRSTYRNYRFKDKPKFGTKQAAKSINVDGWTIYKLHFLNPMDKKDMFQGVQGIPVLVNWNNKEVFVGTKGVHHHKLLDKIIKLKGFEYPIYGLVEGELKDGSWSGLQPSKNNFGNKYPAQAQYLPSSVVEKLSAKDLMAGPHIQIDEPENGSSYIYLPDEGGLYFGKPGTYHWQLSVELGIASVKSGKLPNAIGGKVHKIFGRLKLDTPDANEFFKMQYPELASKQGSIQKIAGWCTSWIYLPDDDEFVVQNQGMINHAALVEKAGGIDKFMNTSAVFGRFWSDNNVKGGMNPNSNYHSETLSDYLNGSGPEKDQLKKSQKHKMRALKASEKWWNETKVPEGYKPLTELKKLGASSYYAPKLPKPKEFDNLRAELVEDKKDPTTHPNRKWSFNPETYKLDVWPVTDYGWPEHIDVWGGWGWDNCSQGHLWYENGVWYVWPWMERPHGLKGGSSAKKRLIQDAVNAVADYIKIDLKGTPEMAKHPMPADSKGQGGYVKLKIDRKRDKDLALTLVQKLEDVKDDGGMLPKEDLYLNEAKGIAYLKTTDDEKTVKFITDKIHRIPEIKNVLIGVEEPDNTFVKIANVDDIAVEVLPAETNGWNNNKGHIPGIYDYDAQIYYVSDGPAHHADIVSYVQKDSGKFMNHSIMTDIKRGVKMVIFAGTYDDEPLPQEPLEDLIQLLYRDYPQYPIYFELNGEWYPLSYYMGKYYEGYKEDPNAHPEPNLDNPIIKYDFPVLPKFKFQINKDIWHEADLDEDIPFEGEDDGDGDWLEDKPINDEINEKLWKPPLSLNLPEGMMPGVSVQPNIHPKHNDVQFSFIPQKELSIEEIKTQLIKKLQENHPGDIITYGPKKKEGNVNEWSFDDFPDMDEDFWDYVAYHNNRDRDSGELLELPIDEIERLADQYYWDAEFKAASYDPKSGIEESY